MTGTMFGLPTPIHLRSPIIAPGAERSTPSAKDVIY